MLAIRVDQLMIICCLFLLNLPSGTVQLQKPHVITSLNSHQDKYNYSNNVHWSCLDSNSSFDCCKISKVLCTKHGPSLNFGYCATFDGANLSIGRCDAYFEPSSYNITTPLYISLPIDLNKLNESMCGPLNRKGLLCSECADGFGISVTTYGYECTNCTGVWYAVPFFLFLEFVPVTVFYLVVLTFKISITSPPMPCFIMYAQIVLYLYSREQQGLNYGVIFLTKNGELTLGMKIIQAIYDLFYLEFFYSISPPICLSSNFNPIHRVVLGYVTVIYPLFLIFLTWVCVKLHDHNVQVVVWLWKPFHKCFVRLHKRWDRTTDLIDVFITFFILFYYKFLRLASTFLTKAERLVLNPSGYTSVHSFVSIDFNLPYFGEIHYFVFVTFSVLVLLIFNILPPLLLILYPTRAFRYCLSKCHLNSHTIIIFTDKLQNCYRNGLDGGRDMRSFSGFYFYLRLTLHFICLTFQLTLKTHAATSLGVAFFTSAVIIALVQPYSKTYMSIIDTLLLTNIALVCLSKPFHLLIIYMLLITPVVGVICLIFVKIILYKNVLRKVKALCNKLPLRRAARTSDLPRDSEAQIVLPTATQLLISATEIRYGSVDKQ